MKVERTRTEISALAVLREAGEDLMAAARRVTIHKPLMPILRAHCRADGERVCPAGWLRHWRELRRAAGWGGDKLWQQDVLRHTFASYHLSYFRSYDLLQVEIGHRDTALLRTRYLDQRGVQAVARFWSELPT